MKFNENFRVVNKTTPLLVLQHDSISGRSHYKEFNHLEEIWHHKDLLRGFPLVGLIVLMVQITITEKL